MNKRSIEKTIKIKTTPEELWRVFTDPVITRQMGGEYVTDWEVGSSFSWKATDGNIYTNGIILQIEPGHILQHSLFNLDDKKVLSVITYKFTGNNDSTILYAREDYEINMTDKEYEDASEGWDFALNTVKEKAENLS